MIFFQSTAYTQAYILSHFILLYFTNVVFFYKLKAEPSTSKKIMTDFVTPLTSLYSRLIAGTKHSVFPRYAGISLASTAIPALLFLVRYVYIFPESLTSIL